MILALLTLGTTAASYSIAKSYLAYGIEAIPRLSLAAFTVVTSASLLLLQMTVVEILAISTASVRSTMFTIMISLLCLNILLCLPLLVIRLATAGIKRWQLRLAVALLCSAIYATMLAYQLAVERAAVAPALWIYSPAVAFSLVSKMGVSMISVLSGFSIVYLPFEYFRYYDSLVANIDKSVIEKDMAAVLDAIRESKMALAQMAIEHERKDDTEEKGLIGSILSAVFGSRQSAVDKAIAGHKRTVKTNQQMLDNLFVDYSEILKEEKNMQASKDKTFWHFLEKSLAVSLMAFGGYKTISTACYLLLGRQKPRDPISVGLQTVVR